MEGAALASGCAQLGFVLCLRGEFGGLGVCFWEFWGSGRVVPVGFESLVVFWVSGIVFLLNMGVCSCKIWGSGVSFLFNLCAWVSVSVGFECLGVCSCTLWVSGCLFLFNLSVWMFISVQSECLDFFFFYCAVVPGCLFLFHLGV